MPARQFTRFCFTLWCNESEDVEAWTGTEHLGPLVSDSELGIRYIFWQLELKPEHHRLHVQGYIEFSPKKTLSAAKSLPLSPSWSQVHMESARGTLDENQTYCSKESDRFEGPWSVGEPAQPGRPTIASLAANLLEHRDIHRFARENPGPYVVHSRGFRELLEATRPSLPFPPTEWRPWQRRILDLLAQPPEQRRIYWIFDLAGNSGKSFLATYLVRDCGALYLTNGRHDRIINAWRGERIVVFDFPRSELDPGRGGDVPYAPIESIKNGVTWAGFGGASMFVGEIPHVICFANYPPNFSRLSADRWIGGVFEIVGQDLTPVLA